MQKFLNQFFPNNTMLALNMENFIFTQADKMIDGYNGGSWKSQEFNGVTILTIPGDAEQVTVAVAMSGNEATTDRLTASAAFTSLVVNWFWHLYARSMNEEQFAAFDNFHQALRDAVYSDNPEAPVNVDTYFTLTD